MASPIAHDRLEEIERAVAAYGMTIAEQRELVRGYRAHAVLLFELRRLVDLLIEMDAENDCPPPDEAEYRAALDEASCVIEIVERQLEVDCTDTNRRTAQVIYSRIVHAGEALESVLRDYLAPNAGGEPPAPARSG